ncbi:MAG TPA: DUF1592 domain-containing protein, partial [Nannocystaceae bacterium]|nr:DUF1592 domain-containing protein [Nannocystaceae bacterium]
MRPSTRLAPRFALAVALLSGCYRGAQGGGADGSGGGGDEGAEGPDTADSDAGGTGDGPADELPGPNTRLFRLTHAQWENTVRDLLRRDEPLGLSDSFREDAKAGPYEFDNAATGLEVDGPLWGQYQRAAVDVATLVTADPTMLAAILPSDPGDETERAREFIATFGGRAFRRPLADAEIDAHLELYTAGRDLYDDQSGFTAGIRAVIEALLQSPSFLYRVEASEDVDGDVIPLDGYEVASRLSYLVWDSMPDDALFAAADADELRDAAQVEEHARRMLADPRASAVIDRFHAVVFDVERYETIAPNPAFYPDAPADLAELAREEFRRFVQHVVLDTQGGVTELLTTNETFANDRLGALYGLDVASSEFERVELDPATRRG